LYEKPPTYLNLKFFGTLCFASTLENSRTKLDPRARKCVFLDFKIGVKGYVLLITTSREIFISRNVIFYENSFLYKTLNQCIEPINDNNKDMDFLLENTTHYVKDNKFTYQIPSKGTTDDVEIESVHDTINDDSTSNAKIGHLNIND